MKPTQVMKKIKALQELGISLPEPLVDSYREGEREEKGIVQLWGCSKCSKTYEAYIPILSIDHYCDGLKEQESRPLKLLKEY